MNAFWNYITLLGWLTDDRLLILLLLQHVASQALTNGVLKTEPVYLSTSKWLQDLFEGLELQLLCKYKPYLERIREKKKKKQVRKKQFIK